ncbi:MAG: substrate-binding domain-containing protein [Acidobacteriaceae bacterium]|nr:substrate-binding domain-containing protein [Acidobacteriaceae bacterium]
MRNSPRVTRRALLGSAAASALVSCARNRRRRIAVLPKGTSHLFWLTVRAGAQAATDQFGVDLLWNGPPNETEYGRQIEIMDSMIAQRVDGIAIAANERKALVQSIDRAMSLGIPVTVFDSGVDSTNYLCFVATDNYEAGKMGARELARLMNGKGTVALAMNAPGSNSTMERERGFEDAIKAEFPAISIVARQFGQSDTSRARAVAENMLTAHPGLNGMFASSEPSSLGTSLALKARSLAGKVKFVAFDSSDSLIEDMKAGVIDALLVQDPFKMGFEAVKTINDKLHGITPPKRLDLSARVVTKADLDKPDVQALLFPKIKN